jgi:hypothetical protein
MPITPGMDIVCSDEVHLATVEGVEPNDWIRLRRDESGTNHFIPASWVRSVDERVHIDRPRRRAVREWSATPR